jgi:hypothetical protein
MAFPITVYITKPAQSASPREIKKALLASLMYPLDLIHSEADLLSVQNFYNVVYQ